VDKIQINLPRKTLKGKTYKIPRFLTKLRWVRINWVPTDLGPATKLLPTAKTENKKTRIIVIDDDNIYGYSLVNTLVSAFERRQSDAIAIYGGMVNHNSFGGQCNYVQGNRYVDRLFGCGGYILTSQMLPSSVYDYSKAPKEAVFVDDNWISGHLNLNRIKIYMIGLKYGCSFFPAWSSVGTISLSGGVNKNHSNDYIVDQWFKKRGCNRHGFN